ARGFVNYIPSKPVISFDTTTAPADEFSLEIKKLLRVSNAQNLGIQLASAFSPGNTTPQGEVYRKRFMQEISTGTGRAYFENFVIRMYRQYFTIEEVKQVTAFYESDAGRKILRILPTLLADIQQQVKPIAEYFASKVLYDLYEEEKK
ncbi:MAG TPA: DUF2059 domain-containing protein, partial [Flavisolibacter sp.]